MHSRLRLVLGHLLSTPTSRFATPHHRGMSTTFTLPNTSIPVHLTSDLSQEQLLSFPAFKTWISTLQHSLSTQRHQSHTFHSAPYKLRQISIQSVDYFGGQRIGFIKLQADVSNDNGEKLPGSVFLRGGSVGMMVGSLDPLSPYLFRCGGLVLTLAPFCSSYFSQMTSLQTPRPINKSS